MTTTPPNFYESWVDLSSQAAHDGGSNIASSRSVPFGGESDYLRMLKEAQRESRRRNLSQASQTSSVSSDKVKPPYLIQAYYASNTGMLYSPVGKKSAPATGNTTPKSPPNSPYMEAEDEEFYDPKTIDGSETVKINPDDDLNTFSVPPYHHSGYAKNGIRHTSSGSSSQCTSPPVFIQPVTNSEFMWDWSSRSHMSRERSSSTHTLNSCQQLKIDEESDSESDEIKCHSQPYTPCQTPPLVNKPRRFGKRRSVVHRVAGGIGVWHRFNGTSTKASLEQLVMSSNCGRSRHVSESSVNSDGGWVVAPSYFVGKEDAKQCAVQPDEVDVSVNGRLWYTVVMSNLLSMVVGFGIGFLIFRRGALASKMSANFLN